MATPAQITANRANAAHSTGPRSDDGKAASAHNATTHGLFAAGDYIPPALRQEFEELEAALFEDLAPARPLEDLWFHQVVSAAWRLRHCLKLEADETAEASVQRARAQAQNQLVRALNELRRLQTERQFRNETFPAGTDLSLFGVASFREILPVIARLPPLPPPRVPEAAPESAPEPVTKQTQSIPRNAPCPCGSGNKFKRCCGRDAPPVLSTADPGERS